MKGMGLCHDLLLVLDFKQPCKYYLYIFKGYGNYITSMLMTCKRTASLNKITYGVGFSPLAVLSSGTESY